MSRKKWDQNVVLQYLLQTSGDSGEIWYIASWINLPLNRINVYHLTWIMSLHYLVNLKCSSRKCYHWAVRQKNSRILSLTSTARLQIRQIRNQLITACREYCKRKCTKHASLIWTNWTSDWERSGPSWITYSMRQPLVSHLSSRVKAGGRYFEHRLWFSLLQCQWFLLQMATIWTVIPYLYRPLTSCIQSVLALWYSNRPHSDLFILQGKVAGLIR